MAYIDKTYFLTKMKESELNNLIKDDDGIPQNDYLTGAVKTADGLINGALKANVKVLPIAAEKIPEEVKQCSYYLAVYFLHDRIQYNDIPERVKDNYDLANNMLAKFKRGEIDLSGLTAEDIDTNVKYYVNDSVMSKDSF